MFTLIINNSNGYKLKIQNEDFEMLKKVAQDYNKKGYNVQILKTSLVYEVSKIGE